MKGIINFFRDRYKILIPIMVILVLIITVFFLYKEYKYDNTRNKKEVSVFQYFNGVRVDYTSVITYNLKDAIVDISALDKQIDANSIPIYYSDKSNVIFPSEMNIVFPLRNGSQYKLYKYSNYYYQDETHFIKNNTDLDTYDDFFLYDGKNVYFFPEKVTIMLNNKEYKELGPMSYVSVVGGLTLVYYDTTTDTSEVIELDGDEVMIVGNHLKVNVKDNYFYSFSNKILLMTPNNLNPVFKTIDK